MSTNSYGDPIPEGVEVRTGGATLAPSPLVNSYGDVVESQQLGSPVEDLFQQRANAREGYTNLLKTMRAQAGREWTQEDEVQVEQAVQEKFPASPGERTIELGIQQDRARQVYEQEHSWPVRYGESFGKGVGRGVVNFGRAAAFLAKVGTFPISKLDQGIEYLSGGEAKDRGAEIYQQAKKLFDSVDEKWLSPTPEEVGAKWYNPYRLSAGLGEMAPDLTALILSGGASESGTIMSALMKVGINRARLPATLLTALHLHGVYDEVYEKGIQKGMSPDLADSVGMAGALVMAPVAYSLNTISPEVLVTKGLIRGNTAFGSTIAAATLNALGSGGQRAAQEIVNRTLQVEDTFIPREDGSGSDLNWAGFRESIQRTGDAAGAGFLTGGILGLGTHAFRGLTETEQDQLSLVRAAIRNATGHDLDLASPRSYYEDLRRTMGMSKIEARLQTNAMSAMMATAGAREGFSEPEAWATWYARQSERMDPATAVYAQDRQTVDGFVSKLRQVVFDTPQGTKQTGGEWLGRLRNAGISPDQLRYSIQRFLEDNQAKQLTKAQVMEAVDRSDVRVRTVNYLETSNQELLAQKQELFKQLEKAQLASVDAIEKYQEAVAKKEDPQKLHELAQDMADKQSIENQVIDQWQSWLDQDNTTYGAYTAPGPKSNYEEILMLWERPPEPQPAPGTETGGGAAAPVEQYQSPHWQEKDVLVHIRMTKRMALDGKPTWHVEEVQSDWKQIQRLVGNTQQEYNKHYDEVMAVLEPLLRKFWATPEGKILKAATEDHPNPNELNPLDFVEPDSPNYALAQEVQKTGDKIRKIVAQGGPVPYAPFDRSWPTLAAKKILLEAVSRGYNRISWSSGELQDVYQGSAEPGRRTFYDKIWPGQVLDAARKYDPGVEIQNIELDTTAQSAEELLKNAPDSHKVMSMEITPTLQENLINKGVMLFQRGAGTTPGDPDMETLLQAGPKGVFRLLGSGRAFLHGLTNPDFETGIHELGHFARIQLLNSKDLATVESLFGVKEGKWTEAKEEQFAEWFSASLRSGHSPRPELAGVFEKTAEFIKDTVPKIEASIGRAILNPEWQGVMDRLFSEDTAPVASAREQLIEEHGNLLKLQEKFTKLQEKSRETLKEPTTEKYVGMADKLLKMENDLERQRTLVSQLADKLERTQQAQFEGPQSFQMQRAQELQRLEHSGSVTNYRRFNQFFDSTFATIGQMAKQMLDGLGGRQSKVLLGSLLDSITSEGKTMRGKWGGMINQTEKRLTRGQRDWLLKDDSSGMTNLQKALEGRISVPKDVQPWYEGFKALWDWAIDKGIEMGMVRKVGSGDMVPTQGRGELSFPRMMTTEGFDFLQNYPTEVARWEMSVAKANEIPFESVKKDVDDFLSGMNQPIQRMRGGLEFSRKLENVPSVHTMENGRKIHIFHDDPSTFLSTYLQALSSRLAWVKFMGQGLLRNWWQNAPALSAVLKQFGFDVELSRGELERALVSKGVIPENRGGRREYGMRELQGIAKNVGVSRYIDTEVMYGILGRLAPQDIPVEKQAQAEAKLREIATKLRGIDSKAPLQQVLAGIKKRLTEDIEDNVARKMIDLHVEEGGRAKDIENLLRLSQGIPLWRPLHATPVGRAVMSFQGITAPLMVSLQTLWQLPQPLMSLPPMVGMLNTIKAEISVLQDTRGATDRAVAAGAIRPPDIRNSFRIISDAFASPTSHGLVRFTRLLQTAAGSLFLTRKSSDLNNIIAAEGGRLYAEEVRDRYSPSTMGEVRLGPGNARDVLETAGRERLIQRDLQRMQNLRLTDSELGQVGLGRMTPDIYNKIIQNTVAESQHVEEAPHRKAFLEQHPIARVFFPFQSFFIGETRRLGTLLGQVYDNRKAGYASPEFRTAAAGLLAASALVVGTGILNQVLSRSMKGLDVKPDEEDWWKWVGGAVLESQLLGPARYLSEPFMYSSDGTNLLLGHAPHMEALISLIDFLWNTLPDSVHPATGRFGEFGIGRRALELVTQYTPLLKSGRAMLEAQAYPAVIDYNNTRRATHSWLRDQGLEKGGFTDEPINPLYEPVWKGLSHLNPSEAMASVEDVYSHGMESGKTFDQVRTALRASLSAHQPIPVPQDKFWQYIAGLSEEKRQKALQVHYQYKAMMDAITGG